MGNTLAPMQRDPSLTDDAKEMLDRLEDTAQDCIDLFYEKIGRDEWYKYLIPISKVLKKHTYIGVTAEGSNSWIQEAKEAVKEFSTGPTADGLCSVATNTIAKMLRSNAGRRQTTQGYAISVDRFGGVSRLDYYIFTYTFSSTELARRKASLVACCVVESSANITFIDNNTLRVIVNHAFRSGDVPLSTLTAIYTQLVTAVHGPTNGPSLTDKEKASWGNWYNTGNQKPLTDGAPNGGDNVSPNVGSPQDNPVIQTGFFPQGNLFQSGFQPVEVGAKE